MGKPLRTSIGLNSEEFEAVLLADRMDSARRFLPRAAVYTAIGLLAFILFDFATDPEHAPAALRWRLLGSALMMLVAFLTRIPLSPNAFSALMMLPPTVLVWTVALAGSELRDGLMHYSGGIGLMLTLGTTWLLRKRTFFIFHTLCLIGLWFLVQHGSANVAGRFTAQETQQTLLIISLLGTLCGAMFFEFLHRLSRRALRLQLELKTESRTDPLTGLPNRRAFMERAADAFKRALRRDQPLALLLIDADRFKRVNDTLGHDVGDAVLQALASALANELGGPVDCARLGGEEFAVLSIGASLDDAGLIAKRLVHAVRQFGWEIESLPPMTISIGASARTAADESLADIMRRADQALYQAKNEGRNCARFG
jgi:diguanylate cyclase (GGDEF)-like protein